MRGVDDTKNAQGLQSLHDRIRDLVGQTFLDLRSQCEPFDDARELAQSRDATTRQVGDVRVPDEGQEVVLADRMERNVPEQHDLIVFFVKDGLEIRLRIDMQSAGKLRVRSRDTYRRPSQALTVRVLAKRNDNLSDRPLDAGEIHRDFARLWR